MIGRTKLIPIWHKVDIGMVAAASPLLADKLAFRSDSGPEVIAEKIAEEFPVPSKVSGAILAERIAQFEHPDLFAGEALYRGCQHRFLQINAFKEEFATILESVAEKLDEQIGDFPQEIGRFLDAENARLRIKHRIPEDVYLVVDEPVREEHLVSYMDDMSSWVSGTLSREESTRLIHDLDLHELDEYYILLDIPNHAISGEQRHYLEHALVEIGCGFDSDYKALSDILTRLHAAE